MTTIRLTTDRFPSDVDDVHATLPKPQPRVWLIGEQNPHSDDPRHDLFPAPEGTAGHRLATKILGLTRYQYLARYGRRNLLHKGERWGVRAAREAASAFLLETFDVRTLDADGVSGRVRLVLLGAKVAQAFGLAFRPFFVHHGVQRTAGTVNRGRPVALMLPHPSGRCRAWNEPGAYERAREAIIALEESC